MSDPYFNFVSLLVQSDTTDASTTFTDSSNLADTVTANGNTQHDTGQKKFGATSILFDGTGDYLSVPNSTTLFDVDGDWTIEGWFRVSSLASDVALWSTRKESPNEGIQATVSSTGVLQVLGYSSAGSIVYNQSSAASTIATDTWYHIACVKSGTTIDAYVDGTSALTGSTTGTIDQGGTNFDIGRINVAADNLEYDGWAEDFRITSAIPRYTAAFTAPTVESSTTLDEDKDPFFGDVELLVKFEGTDGDTAITDLSKNGITTSSFTGTAQIDDGFQKFGDTSLFLDGNSDYIDIAGETMDDIGTQDFTIEQWVYLDSSTDGILFEARPSATNGQYPLLFLSTGKVVYYKNSVSEITSTNNISTGQWAHVAVSRVNDITRLFIDGVEEGSFTDTATYSNWPTNRPVIGVRSFDFAGSYLDGNVDELRVTVGTGRYVHDFSVPTQTFALQEIDVQKATFTISGKLVTLTYSGEAVYELDVQKRTFELLEDTVLLFGPDSVLPLEAQSTSFTASGGNAILAKHAVLGTTKDTLEVDDRYVVLGDNGEVISLSLNVNTKPVFLLANFFTSKDTINVTGKDVSLDYDEVPKPITVPAGINVFQGDWAYLPARGALWEARFEDDILRDKWYRDADDSFLATVSPFGYPWILAHIWTVATNEPTGAVDLYSIVTTKDGRTAESNRFTVTVFAKLKFTTHPSSTTLGSGSTANFSVAATGNGVLTYQWYENEVLMSGETGTSLSVTSIQTSDDGNTYYASVTDDNETISSNRATLNVRQVPAISTQPSDTTVEDTFPYTFSVLANGTGTINYQWYQNAVLIGGAVNPSYTTNAALVDSGDTFYVEITDDFGTATSSTGTLTVSTIALAVTTDVIDIIEIDSPANTAVFTVVAKGDPTITYQWYEVAPNDDRTLLSGETASTLTVDAELVDNGKRYQVDISDNDEGPISSRIATLTVLEGAPFSFVTSGFNNREIIVDRGISYQMQPRTLNTTFGEGYQQRIPDGLENLEDTFNITVSNQPRDIIQDIQGFFDSVVGTTAFEFFIPNELEGDSIESVPVRCVSWSTVQTTQRFYTITATFERVREVL